MSSIWTDRIGDSYRGHAEVPREGCPSPTVTSLPDRTAYAPATFILTNGQAYSKLVYQLPHGHFNSQSTLVGQPMMATSQTSLLSFCQTPSHQPIWFSSSPSQATPRKLYNITESYRADARCTKNKLSLTLWPQYLLLGSVPILAIPKEMMVQTPTPLQVL